MRKSMLRGTPVELRICVRSGNALCASGLDDSPAFADIVTDRLLDIYVLPVAWPRWRPGRASDSAVAIVTRSMVLSSKPCGCPARTWGLVLLLFRDATWRADKASSASQIVATTTIGPAGQLFSRGPCSTVHADHRDAELFRASPS